MHVSFREEECRVWKDHAPQNLDTLRQISHNLLKKASSPKTGIQGKRPNAGWRGDYLLKVLPGQDAIALMVDSRQSHSNVTANLGYKVTVDRRLTGRAHLPSFSPRRESGALSVRRHDYGNGDTPGLGKPRPCRCLCRMAMRWTPEGASRTKRALDSRCGENDGWGIQWQLK